MTRSRQPDWTAYYNARSGRPPRALFLETLAQFDIDCATHGRQAIDLGCGEGSDTVARF